MPHPAPAILNAETIHDLLSAGAQERVAMLAARSSPRTLAESLAALANASGGHLLYGVDERGRVQRTNDAAALQEALTRACALLEPPLVLPLAQVVLVDSRPLVAVEVPPGLPNVYNLQGVFLTRSGPLNRPLTTPELRRLLLARGEPSIETQILAEASPGELDARRIDEYLDRLLPGPGDDANAMLVARGCLAVDAGGELRPTMAGLLLFGPYPQRFLPAAEIVCVRYPGSDMGDEFVRQEIAGPLPEQIRQAEAFVLSTMRRGMRIRGLEREEVPEYPTAVVREAIVNAVAHRDYAISGEGIRLLIFRDRLEIYSPGRLAGHVTLANLKDERYSRNQVIVTVLSDMGFVERLGYGIDRMIGVLRAAGQPDPLFTETAAGFQVTLRSALAGDLTGALRPSAADRAGGELNERQRQALAFVQENGRIANSDLQAMAPDVSAETIRRDLADLVERNLLIRIGAKRATYYIRK